MSSENIGEYIKRIRNEKDITLKTLSATIGYSEAYISMVENGKKNNPSYEFLSNVAKGMAITDGDERTKIHGKLLELAGYSEINYVDSFYELFSNSTPSLNLFNSVANGVEFQKQLDFPVNDLYFHLTDENNKKMYKSIILNDNDRKYINSMIEMYLLRKYEIKKYDRDNEITYTDKEFEDIEDVIKNKNVNDYFKKPNKEGN